MGDRVTSPFGYETLVTDLADRVPFPVVPDRTPVRPYAVRVRPDLPWVEPGTYCAHTCRYVLDLLAFPADSPNVEYDTAALVWTVLAGLDDLDNLTLTDVGPPDLTNIGGVDYVTVPIRVTVDT